MHAEITGLAVLFEDMRIELAGASGESYPELDTMGAKHRKLYFLRRAIATSREFGEALRHLEGDSDFRTIRREFQDTEAIEWWSDGVSFFKRNAKYLQRIRNDSGGHFSRSAGFFAIKNVQPEIIGKTEINFKDHKANPKACFVVPLVDEAMLGRRGEQNREDYAKILIAFAYESFERAARCVQIILKFYLIPRFGK